ncbi:MAG: helix-hairpin-helix domain-containing protein [Thermoplasmata archaeon]|nr:helix-hairpin-helix domain-containing protein [Thermoplasmata archaeon]
MEDGAEKKAIVEFTRIPSIGLARAKKLYEAGYHSIEDLKKASFEELARINGIGETHARAIKEHFGDKPVKKPFSDFRVKKVAVEVSPGEDTAENNEETSLPDPEMEKELLDMEKELKETEEFIEKSKVSTGPIVFEKKVKVEKGKVVVRKRRFPTKGVKVGTFILASFLILTSVFVLWYATRPTGRIMVDGNIDDWEGIARYTDSIPVFNQDINLNEYSVYYENDRVYFYARVPGSLYNGANNGYDALVIFVDTDGNPATGYRIENLGVDAKIEVAGYGGEIRSASVSRFIPDSASAKPELNYSAWENAGEVRVEKTDRIVEGYAKVAGLENPVSLVVMRHYEGSTYAEKRGAAVVGKAPGSLVIYQNFVAGDVVNLNDDVVELKVVAKGGNVKVSQIAVSNAVLNLPKNELGPNEEFTVRAKANELGTGTAYEFGVASVTADVPYRIVGAGGKAYFGSLPSGIVIDGAFGDWEGVQKGTDVPGDAPRNIDLREYASAISSNAYFYMAVDGSMLAGCEIPVVAGRPPVQPGPPAPVVIKENLGLDVARVYIDLINSTINTFNPAMISHGYLIELQGRNGQVVSAKVWKWENGMRAEEISSSNIVYGLSDGKIEIGIGLAVLPGIDGSTKFYFEMSNWLGEKDVNEMAYLAGREGTRVGGGGNYGSSLLADFTGTYNKVVLVNDRYTSTTKGALRLENATIAYGGLNATDVDAGGNLTVSNTRYWNGTYYFRHLKIAGTGNITASGYMTVIRIYAEVIEVETGGVIYLAGRGGKGGAGGAAGGGDGYTGQDGNDSSGPSASNNGQADGGAGGGGILSSNNYGGFGGGGGGFAGNGGNGGQGAKDGALGVDGTNGYYGRGGIAYASAPNLKPGSGGGGGSGGDGGNSAAGGAGGHGGGAILLNAWNIYINGRIIANGTDAGNGEDGDRPGAGGGGGSGGCILVQGCNVTVGANAEFNASGGAGGNAGADTHDASTDDEAGGGGGGGGGAIWIYADNAYSESSGAKFNVSGGVGGLGSVGAPTPLNNNGVNGTAGNISKPAQGAPPSPRTTFTSNLSYALTGYYVSQVLDAGRIALWRTLNWTRDTHWGGTQVTLRVRWGNTSLPDATWHAWQDVNGTMSGGNGPLSETFNLAITSYPFARFFQYNITIGTSVGMNSPTIYRVNLTYSKPKVLIASVIFNPYPTGGTNHSVVLANNDSFPVIYSTIYLNSSANSYSTPLSLTPGSRITVPLSSSFFLSVNISGDFLFLNDSTSSISGLPPHGIVDFVNWTDRNGGEPPPCGNYAAIQNEWTNGAVNLTGFDPLTQIGINRSVIMDAPVDTDTKADWYVIVGEQTGSTPLMLVLMLIPCIVIVRKERGQKLRKL